MRVIVMLCLSLLANSAVAELSMGLKKARLGVLSQHRFRKVGERVVDLTTIVNRAANEEYFDSEDGWKLLDGKVLQVQPGKGLLMSIKKSPFSEEYETVNVFLKTPLEPDFVDEDRIFYLARKTGRMTYDSNSGAQRTMGAQRTIETYDFGEIPSKNEIKPFIEAEEKAYNEEQTRQAEQVRRQAEHAAAQRERAKAAAILKKQETESKVVVFQRKQAEGGGMTAQYDIGVRYWNGNGVEKDTKKAREWVQKSADQGYGPAKTFLADNP